MKIENNIPKEVLELLPWFATKKLSSEDKSIFDGALNTYPSLQKQVDNEHEFINKITANKSILHKRVIAPPEERLKVVFNAIDNPVVNHHKKPKLKTDSLDTFFTSLKNTFESITSPDNTKAQFATFAGVGALILSVAVITAVVIPSYSEKSDFTLASASVESTSNQTTKADSVDIILLVGFSGSSEELSNLDVLKGKKIDIQSPADKEGFFEISFKQTLNEDEIKQTVDGLLEHKDKVWFAGEAY